MSKIKGLSQELALRVNNGEMLPVMEEFYTLQGEGYFTGKAAWFIRVGGCDVGCHWCDVKESWNPNHFPPKETIEVARIAIVNKADTVVVTGGEPLNYNLDLLTSILHENQIQCHIETSGSSVLSGQWDWICLSPKKNKKPLKEIYPLANELKVIIEDESDFIWAEENAEKIGKDCQLYLQPEWSKHESVTPIIIDYILKNTKWKISLQSHKFMRIP